VGNVRRAKSTRFLVFARVLKLPSEERPRFVPIFAWKVGRSLGRMGGWWQHRKFDQQLWLRISLAVSRCKDWIFVRYLFTDDLFFCIFGQSRYFSINWNRICIYYIYIHTYVHINILYSLHRFLPNFLFLVHIFCSVSCPISALSTFCFGRLGTPRNGNSMRHSCVMPD